MPPIILSILILTHITHVFYNTVAISDAGCYQGQED